ncbi:MAG: hypothetical protein M1825_002397 [Sarcosagium campestre]|nr:MAG: hypothetical protein M1825_002397 [Sarcosagium campestre]
MPAPPSTPTPHRFLPRSTSSAPPAKAADGYEGDSSGVTPQPASSTAQRQFALPRKFTLSSYASSSSSPPLPTATQPLIVRRSAPPLLDPYPSSREGVVSVDPIASSSPPEPSLPSRQEHERRGTKRRRHGRLRSRANRSRSRSSSSSSSSTLSSSPLVNSKTAALQASGDAPASHSPAPRFMIHPPSPQFSRMQTTGTQGVRTTTPRALVLPPTRDEDETSTTESRPKRPKSAISLALQAAAASATSRHGSGFVHGGLADTVRGWVLGLDYPSEGEPGRRVRINEGRGSERFTLIEGSLAVGDDGASIRQGESITERGTRKGESTTEERSQHMEMEDEGEENGGGGGGEEQVKMILVGKGTSTMATTIGIEGRLQRGNVVRVRRPAWEVADGWIVSVAWHLELWGEDI